MADDFVFTYQNEQFWLDDLSIAEAVEIEAKIGEWSHWRPIGLVEHRLTLMTVFLRRTRSEDEVVKILESLTLGESRALWDRRQNDLPEVYEDGVPNLGAGPSTLTS